MRADVGLCERWNAKDDVDNVGAGRAAKSAIPERDCGNAEQSLFRRIAPYDRTSVRLLCKKSCINAVFLCIFDGSMRSKIEFFDKNPCFWRPFWRPHLNIVFLL